MRPSVLQSISKDKNVMARTRKYYLKNHYLTLRSKVKVPRRSLRYATHHLVVIHLHTKYYWPISKDKIVMAWTRKYYLKNNYLTLRSKVRVQWRSLRYATHRLMVIHPHTKYHWPISKETIIWPLGQRSRSNEGHYGMRHTALWSCTHIPNIIDHLERKKCYGPDKLRWEEAEAEAEEAEEKIRLKQYVSLRSKGRHNKHYGNVVICFWKVWKEKLMRTKNGDIIYVHMTCFWNNLYRVRLTGKPTNLKKK
jgi:hypothetical protein